MSPAETADLHCAIGAEIARRSEIVAAWIFGSVARAEARAASDLDVAVLRRPDAARGGEWRYDLASSLERYSPSGMVDIVDIERQGVVLRHRVLREGVLIHDSDPQLRVAFEAATIAEYLDWKPTHDIAMRSVFSGLHDRFAPGGR